ncbi:uncharacterized protein LOC127102913 [Lathyrus oleraceus]|uniref:uncharacterized protein LOC127102913 n=1 Tax=Pisum sativum TaxID=3888 RepID=UPI0021D1EC66|nr:uncharacterized protein LOC127102913 [Pisum sativum]
MVNAVDGTKQFGRGRGNGSFTAERGRGNMKVCTYCGKTGHIIDNCYKKHGYPPNLGRGSSYANQVEVYDSDNKPAVTSTGDNGSMSLIREKYKNLMVLLDKTHDLSTFPREINLTLLALMQIVVSIYMEKKNLIRIGSARELDGLYYLEASQRDSNICFVSRIFSNKKTDDVVMLKSEVEVCQKIQDFLAMVETQFAKRIKTIRSDNGTELLIPAYYASKGLPKKFWSYVVLHAIFLMNRIPTKVMKNKSYYEAIYASTIKNNKHKFDSRARKCAFSGYNAGMKGFVLLDTDNHEIIISRNMKFFDMEFPYLDKSNPHVPTNTYLDYHHSTIGDTETEPTNSYVHNPIIESEHVPQIIESEPIQFTDTSKTSPDHINKFK